MMGGALAGGNRLSPIARCHGRARRGVSSDGTDGTEAYGEDRGARARGGLPVTMRDHPLDGTYRQYRGTISSWTGRSSIASMRRV